MIVIDNESDDGTQDAALYWGARVITVERNKFSFPLSLNVGAEAATGEIVLFVVGHAIPFKRDWLKCGIEHFNDPRVAGVYSPVVPLNGCTLAETLFYWPGYLIARWQGPHCVRKGGMGVFGATNIALRKSLWEAHPFDERYGLGGEDGEWAGWALSQGHKIICDPGFAVRHSHGLGFRGLKKQFQYWSKLGGPTTFRRDEFDFRHDLKF